MLEVFSLMWSWSTCKSWNKVFQSLWMQHLQWLGYSLSKFRISLENKFQQKLDLAPQISHVASCLEMSSVTSVIFYSLPWRSQKDLSWCSWPLKTELKTKLTYKTYFICSIVLLIKETGPSYNIFSRRNSRSSVHE